MPIRTRVNSTSNDDYVNRDASLGTMGFLSNPGFFQITHQSRNCRKCKHRFNDRELQPDLVNLPQMEGVMAFDQT